MIRFKHPLLFFFFSVLLWVSSALLFLVSSPFQNVEIAQTLLMLVGDNPWIFGVMLVFMIGLGTLGVVGVLVVNPGFKRLPFWTALIVGVVLQLVTLGMVSVSRILPITTDFAQTLGGSSRGFPVIQGLVVSMGWVSFMVAAYAQRTLELKAKPVVVGILTMAVLVVFGPGLFAPEFAQQFQPVDLTQGVYGVQQLIRSLHPELREDARENLQRIQEDQGLTAQERLELIAELTRKLQEAQGDRERFQESQRQNQALRQELEQLSQELARLEEQIGQETGFCGAIADDVQPVSHVSQGVRPGVACVRDFAVTVASTVPGAYTQDGVTPTVLGLKQVIALHRIVNDRWKYVSDPIGRREEYFSPAERTIGLGFAGDCDDYAIVLASLVEAIGGRTRIVAGFCAEGGHAWPEVFVGNRNQFDRIARELTNLGYPRLGAQMDSRGDYWLSLDWVLGQYTYSGNNQVLYVTPTTGR